MLDDIFADDADIYIFIRINCSFKNKKLKKTGKCDTYKVSTQSDLAKTARIILASWHILELTRQGATANRRQNLVSTITV